MALAYSTEWEVQTTGDNQNGGGFNPLRASAGTNYSYGTPTTYTYTDLVVDASVNTKITSATRQFEAADVGNIIHITSYGTACDFNGTNQFLSTRANDAQNYTQYRVATSGAFSIACWVYLDTKTSNRGILSRANAGATAREIELIYNSSTDRFTFSVGPNTSSVTTVTASTFGSPSTATWYFICCTYNNGTIKISVNDGGVDSNTGATTTATGNNLLWIGRSNNSYMDGRIDSVGFWRDKELSAAEITALYNSGNGLNQSLLEANALEANLAGWWDLEETTAAGTRYDYCTAGNLAPTSSPQSIAGVGANSGWIGGRYEIVSVTAGAATLDRSPAPTSSTGGKGILGGALANINGANNAARTSYNRIHVKSGTYDITTPLPTPAGGRLIFDGTNYIMYFGYGSTRNDNGTKPLLKAASGSALASTNLITISYSDAIWMENFEIDCNSVSNLIGIHMRNYCFGAYKVSVHHGLYGFNTGGRSVLIGCDSYNNTYGYYGCSNVYQSMARSNTYGYYHTGGGVNTKCVAMNNTNAGFLGEPTNYNCIGYNNGGNNFYGDKMGAHIDCISWSASSTGFATNTAFVAIFNCASDGTLGGKAEMNEYMTRNSITLTADPFVDAANYDFRLNNTAGGGALLRNAGYSFWPFSTTSYHDLGIAEAKDTEVTAVF